MGSGIAAQVANAGVNVTLLDLPSKEGSRNQITENAKERIIKSKPPLLVEKEKANLILTGNIDDDFKEVEQADWVVEAVVERIDIKHNIYSKIQAVRKNESIISSNTSTIPLKILSANMSDNMKKKYAADVETFYKVFTGNSTKPDSVTNFSDIKLRDFASSAGCKKDSIYRQSYDGSREQALFKQYAEHIQKMIKRDLILKKVPNGDEICQIQLMKLVDKVVSNEINNQIETYLPSIEEKLAHLDKELLIKHFLSVEFNRFLLFYKNAPDLNISTSKKKYSNEKRGRNNRKETRPGHAEKGHTRFFINIGKDKGLQTHNLIGLINEHTRNRNIPIGKIDIMKRFSFFEVPSEFETEILSQLTNAKWNSNKINVEVSQVPNSKNSRNRRNRSSRNISRDRKRNEHNSLDVENTKTRKRRYSKRKIKKVNERRYTENIDSSFKDRFNAVTKRKRKS